MQKANLSFAIGTFHKREIGIVLAKETNSFIIMVFLHRLNSNFHLQSVHFDPEIFSEL